MFLRKLYSCWVIFAMAVFFLLFIIPLCICALFPSLHRLALKINYLWASGFFKLAFISIEKTWHFTPKKTQRYILCANHFSYLDIPALGLFSYPFKFVGKSQLTSIPLFGFMYQRIHITVNRSSFRSRGETLEKARKVLEQGFNLGFFPEGGILFKNYPEMVPFKDGAFRIAAESNTPIIPVTFPDNYRILADDNILDMKPGKCNVTYHEPIFPGGSSEEDIKKLKDDVFRVIQSELYYHSQPSKENTV